MKKYFCIVLVLLTLNSFASEVSKDSDKNLLGSKKTVSLADFNKSVNSSDTDYDLSLLNLQVDVLGLVFFGPQVSLDFQFANMIAVGPYVRWHYAGVMYQAVVTDWFTDESSVSMASFSYGGQIKFLIPVGSGKHRPFIGLGVEKSKGEEKYTLDSDAGHRINEFEQNIFHFDLGYRYLSGSAFNLSVGLGIGLSKDTKNIGYYELEKEFYDSYSLETRVLPMIQLQLGWQLGK